MNLLQLLVFMAFVPPVQGQFVQPAQPFIPFQPDTIFIDTTTTQEAPHGTTPEPPTTPATTLHSVPEVQPDTVQPGFLPWNMTFKDALIIILFVALLVIGKSYSIKIV